MFSAKGGALVDFWNLPVVGELRRGSGWCRCHDPGVIEKASGGPRTDRLV